MQEIKKINLSLEFKYYKINDIGEVVSGGTPSTSKNEYWYGDIGWITPKDLSSYDDIYISRGERNISSEGLNNSSAKLVPKNTVLMTSRAPIGYIAIANNELSTNQGFKSLICNEKICHYKYFYYWLKLNIKYIINNSNGSTFKEISGGTFKNLELSLPSLNEQKAISSVLWTIDEKISVLKRINKNLQKQINILFKSFFINFEFYDGKYQETLFGEIPIEWNIILFKDILNERNEKSTNQDISMYSVTLDGIQPRADIYKKKITAKTTKFKIIHKYDLIFGMPNSGYQYGIMYDEIGGVSLAYPVFEINGIQPRYVDLFIKNISNYFNDIVKSGSRMGQGIDKKVLLSKEIYVPPNEHLDKYYSIESKLLDLINHNLTEINNLTKLRDTLLPKLMSGEIDVSKINCDLELKYNYMKYLFNQIHTPMSKSVV